jgi:hypothetical protein
VEARVGRLHCRYRVPPGDGGLAASAVAALDRVAHERVAPALEESLERALGDDPSVYVLRRVDAGLLLAAGGAPEQAVGRRLGVQLATAIVRRIATDAGDGSNLVRFENGADYVASFLRDLLSGRAWEQWFYGAFRPLQQLAPPEAARRVLLEDRERLPEVLARLSRSGTLERLLAILDPATVRDLWSRELAEPEPESIRPLLAAALALAERLGFSVTPGRGLDDVLASYLRQRPAAPDWRDRTSLARSLLEALRFLVREPHPSPPEQADALVDDALSELDWLDAESLREPLLALLGAWPEPAVLPPAPPLPPTPRQRRLLAELGALLARGEVALDLERIASEANGLRLYAALVAAAPEWAGDNSARALIGRVLAAMAEVAHGGFGSAARRLREGNVGEAWRALPSTSSPEERAAFALVAELGPAGLRLAEEVTADRATPVAPSVESACAGVALVMRATLDLGLARLVHHAHWPASATATLLALGLRLAGDAGVLHGRLDPALGLLAGLEPPPELADLRRSFLGVTPADAARWQGALLETLVERGLAGGEELELVVASTGSGSALLAGTDGAWVFGRSLDEAESGFGAAERWAEEWAATGGRARLVQGGAVSPFAPLVGGLLGCPDADLVIGLTALALLRAWIAWLPGFERSSPGYVLEQLVRRPGRVRRDGRFLVVELERRPLDLVLELAGYTAELEDVPPLAHPLRFELRDA